MITFEVESAIFVAGSVGYYNINIIFGQRVIYVTLNISLYYNVIIIIIMVLFDGQFLFLNKCIFKNHFLL